MHVYVLYGQGGVITSYGMKLLAEDVARQNPRAVVETRNWEDYERVRDEINKQVGTTESFVVIGYSLGANALGAIAQGLKRDVALMVGYDPSVWSPSYPLTSRVKRAIHFKNLGFDFFGRADMLSEEDGPKIEVHGVYDAHLAICWDKSLHAITLEAVSEVAKNERRS